jgi:DNA-directed RNA polymerase specialized sigma24 family protein
MNPTRIAENKKLFRKFRGGDASALVEILESERHNIYDYMMRMTGQVQKSAETIEEVYISLNEGVLTELQAYEDLRLLLYTTTRKFSADIWNANTSMLENSGILNDVGADPLTEEGLHQLKLQQDLDRGIRVLKAFEREVVYLRLVVGMAFSEIADVVGNTQSAVDDAYSSAINELSQSIGKNQDEIEDGLHRICKHPLPPRSSPATVNLSMVMEGIKTKPSGLRSVKKIVALVVLAGLIAAWFLFPTLTQETLEFLRNLLRSPS